MMHSSKRSHYRELYILVFILWVLSFASYSPTGLVRSAPLSFGALDWLAIVKVISRVIALILLSIFLYRIPKTRQRRLIIKCLLPFFSICPSGNNHDHMVAVACCYLRT